MRLRERKKDGYSVMRAGILSSKEAVKRHLSGKSRRFECWQIVGYYLPLSQGTCTFLRYLYIFNVYCRELSLQLRNTYLLSAAEGYIDALNKGHTCTQTASVCFGFGEKKKAEKTFIRSQSAQQSQPLILQMYSNIWLQKVVGSLSGQC